MDAEIGRPRMELVDSEEMMSLQAIRRLSQAYLLSSDHQHDDQRRTLEQLLAEHYRRFEARPQERWKGRVA